MFAFGARSKRLISQVHPDLARVLRAGICITSVDFGVIEAKRSQVRQVQLFDSGATMTLHSRHLTGHAVDVMAYVNGKGRWDWPLYERIAVAMKDASRSTGIPIVWGGDWVNFPDGPHFELPWSSYP